MHGKTSSYNIIVVNFVENKTCEWLALFIHGYVHKEF